MGFTKQQMRAVKCPVNTHMKIPAVAGSGKSTVLAARVNELINHGVRTDQILIVMFNKAARIEFTGKLKKVLKGKIPEVRTFHSFGNKLLNSFIDKGLLPKYELEKRPFVQSSMAKEALLRVLDEQDSDEDVTKKVVEEFVSYVDRVKSEIDTPADVFADVKAKKSFSFFVDAFDVFEDMRKERKVRFFSDLIYDPVQVMLNNKEVRDWVGNGHVTHILVDEYQDINAISQYLIKVVANDKAMVTCVGDADQTIYEFRGSRPEYIVHKFDEDFPNAAVHPLTRTFRYGHALSLFANHVITNNRQREKTLCLSSSHTKNTEIELFKTGHPHPIVDVVKEWTAQGRKLREIAVLVRLFSMSVPVELSLLSNGIPYKIEGSDSVLNIKEINALVGLLKLANGTLFDEKDEYLLEKTIHEMLSTPHIGLKTEVLQKVVKEIMRNPEVASTYITRASEGLKPFQVQTIADRAALWDEIATMGDVEPEKILERYIKATDMFAKFVKMAAYAIDAENQIECVNGLMAYAKVKGLPLDAFLDHIEQLRAQEVASAKTKDDHILITSIHRSKGLEWPLVVLPDLAEGKFPHFKKEYGKQTRISTAEVESERRLFYVAVTRAKEKVVLLIPTSDEEILPWIAEKRTGYPRAIEAQENSASRFVYEGNLKLSLELGRALHSKEGITQSISAHDPEIANKYLMEIGVPNRVSSTN